MDMNKDELMDQIRDLRKEYGDWSYDIPLPFGIWTKGDLKIPHTRLKRIVQVVSDLAGKPLSHCRVLDLGCLDGQFSIEFAQQGAQTTGIEIREANLRKAIFCKEVLNLNNLEFSQDDALNISVQKYGRFDAIICSGLLYHLTAADAIGLITKMYEMSDKMVIIDTHIALKAAKWIVDEKEEYSGVTYTEHSASHDQGKKATLLWASWDNTESFWFTRPSLVNILSKAGFSSIYECFTPVHLNYGKPGMECYDRCTFVAIRGEKLNMVTSPAANNLEENWPEKSLSYNRGAFRSTRLKLQLKKNARNIKRRFK